jgi:hypothetical protein
LYQLGIESKFYRGDAKRLFGDRLFCRDMDKLIYSEAS